MNSFWLMPILAVIVAQVGAFGWGFKRADRSKTSSYRVPSELRKPLLVILLFAFIILAMQLDERVAQRLPMLLQGFGALIFCLLVVGIAGFICGHICFVANYTKDGGRLRKIIVVQSMSLAAGLATQTGIYRTLEPNEKGGVVLQSTGVTCAAASLANVARIHHVTMSERDAAYWLRTTLIGTHPGNMRYALHHLKFDFETLGGRYSDLAQVPTPAILYVDHPIGREAHAIVFKSHRDGQFIIVDPLVGERTLTAQQIHSIWRGNGEAILGRL